MSCPLSSGELTCQSNTSDDDGLLVHSFSSVEMEEEEEVDEEETEVCAVHGGGWRGLRVGVQSVFQFPQFIRGRLKRRKWNGNKHKMEVPFARTTYRPP